MRGRVRASVVLEGRRQMIVVQAASGMQPPSHRTSQHRGLLPCLTPPMRWRLQSLPHLRLPSSSSRTWAPSVLTGGDSRAAIKLPHSQPRSAPHLAVQLLLRGGPVASGTPQWLQPLHVSARLAAPRAGAAGQLGGDSMAARCRWVVSTARSFGSHRPPTRVPALGSEVVRHAGISQPR